MVSSAAGILSPWVQLLALGQGGWSSPTLNVPFLSDPLGLNPHIDARHDMHYSRFLTSIGNQARSKFTELGQRTPSEQPDMQTSQLENSLQGLKMSVTISNVGRDDRLVHDFSVVVANLSAKGTPYSADINGISLGEVQAATRDSDAPPRDMT